MCLDIQRSSQIYHGTNYQNKTWLVYKNYENKTDILKFWFEYTNLYHLGTPTDETNCFKCYIMFDDYTLVIDSKPTHIEQGK